MSKFDWSVYGGGVKWLRERTVYVTRHGSHAYGTSTPESDIDLRGIAVAPMRCYLGVSETFEQAVQHDPIDLTIFDLRKFVKLASDANPNTLEILFTEQSDHLLVHPVMQALFAARHAFLSTKVRHTFSGYARSQLKRINAHYRWLRNPPKTPPTRLDLGLPERTVIPADQLAAAQAAVQKQLDAWNWHEMDALNPAQRQAVQDEFTRKLLEITQWGWDEAGDKTWLAAARCIGLDENFIRLMDLERQYTARVREWQQYQQWKATRNPARAALEERYGFDTKHALHLVRLTRMCRELLAEGVVRVRRPDAEELLEIRRGTWTYEQLIAYSDAQDAEIETLAKASKLPRQPDRETLDNVCIEMIQRMG